MKFSHSEEVKRENSREKSIGKEAPNECKSLFPDKLYPFIIYMLLASLASGYEVGLWLLFIQD